jgi:hypothetical protein
VSALLDAAVRSDRVRCADAPSTAESKRTLSVTVKPGDAYEADPGEKPTERAEIQVRRELVRFDATTWYSFMLRVNSPWLEHENRTVVHQIKQNIDKHYEIGRGEKEICGPANPLFKIEVGSNGTTPVFRAKTTGTKACGDDVGKKIVCEDRPLSIDTWHRVHVAIRPSQEEGASYLKIWLDGQPCPTFSGLLGYPRFGVKREGRPVVDTQPRFGIYRDAIPATQTVQFADIAFWDTKPVGHPAWNGIELIESN